MKICRFEDDRLGIVDGSEIVDLSGFLEELPAERWAFPLACPVIQRLPALQRYVESHAHTCARMPYDSVRLHSPVPRPSKIIGAPVNFHAHLDEARADDALHQGRHVYPIDEIGLFLKAGSALAGPATPLSLSLPDRRTDPEAEVAVVIGREAKDVDVSDAAGYIAGYSLALDISIRGKEDRSMRKSPDGYAVLGPYLVTADEVDSSDAIEFELTVNGEVRQQGNTALLIRSVPELIAMASRFYTLHPGDVIMTGTPAGVAPIYPGDQLRLTSPALGCLEVVVAG